MEETYLERIKKLKSTQKITNDKLSELTGIPLGTLSKLLAGISDSPKLSNMVAISQALGCSLDWLITGVPENTNNYTLSPEEISLVEEFRRLDHYGRTLVSTVVEKESERTAAQKNAATAKVAEPAAPAHRYKPSVAPTPAKDAGMPADAPARILPLTERPGALPSGLRRRRIAMYDLPVSAGVGEFLSESTRTDIMIPDTSRTVEADYALRISGDSMEPKYHSGDVLLVQTAESVVEGELGIFVLDGSGYFKKYGGDRLLSLNPAYAPIMLKDFTSMTCCGRVVGKLKRK